MQEKELAILKNKMDEKNLKKLTDINNDALHSFIAYAAELCNPETIFVCSDDKEDISYIRKRATETGEEKKLSTEGHTIHFDGYYDQGRDKSNTKYLVPEDMELGSDLNCIDKKTGLKEITDIMNGLMEGREMIVRFFCLGPTSSQFSISAVQVTDSTYVAHSEDILYRAGYNQFKNLGNTDDFFKVIHSAGKLENNISTDIDNRRIYIDFAEDLVYSANTQYAGNTVGFKKLALRLAIRKADREKWFAEHMFVMGVHGPSNRITYFTGAFPSACGKTSTAMLRGESIIGDDIAYLRTLNNEVRAVNVESGIFGIIQDVNAKDDPEIWKVLSRPGEVIFSNVLKGEDNNPYWLGDGRPVPEKGINFSGEWHKNKKDEDGNEIPHAHKNARYTIRLNELDNLDKNAENPNGVPVKGIIFGGRDSDTWVPVQESFNWTHGVITMGASLESETTSATLGQEGVRVFQPMSNIDFVSITLGKYMQNHLDLVNKVNKPPIIFSVNYFIRDKHGKLLTGMFDKSVWIKWMELRVHKEVEAIKTPTGFIPYFEDVKQLFKKVLNKEYTIDDYNDQFKLRIRENLHKLDRIEGVYRVKVPDTPQTFFDSFACQRERLKKARKIYGDYIKPEIWIKDKNIDFDCI